jgi:hypothetical protein
LEQSAVVILLYFNSELDEHSQTLVLNIYLYQDLRKPNKPTVLTKETPPVQGKSPLKKGVGGMFLLFLRKSCLLKSQATVPADEFQIPNHWQYPAVSCNPKRHDQTIINRQ